MVAEGLDVPTETIRHNMCQLEQQEQLVSRKDYGLWRKVGFLWQPATFFSVIGPRPSTTRLSEWENAPKKYGYCLVICSRFYPLPFSEQGRSFFTIDHKSDNRQCKIWTNWTNSASFATFTGLLAYRFPLYQVFRQLREKCLKNQDHIENDVNDFTVSRTQNLT